MSMKYKIGDIVLFSKIEIFDRENEYEEYISKIYLVNEEYSTYLVVLDDNSGWIMNRERQIYEESLEPLVGKTCWWVQEEHIKRYASKVLLNKE